MVSDKFDNKVLKTITKAQKNIENKFKAMESITKISNGNLIYKEGSKIKLGERIDGDAVIHIAVSFNNAAAIVLKNS